MKEIEFADPVAKKKLIAPQLRKTLTLEGLEHDIQKLRSDIDSVKDEHEDIRSHQFEDEKRLKDLGDLQDTIWEALPKNIKGMTPEEKAAEEIANKPKRNPMTWSRFITVMLISVIMLIGIYLAMAVYFGWKIVP